MRIHRLLAPLLATCVVSGCDLYFHHHDAPADALVPPPTLTKRILLGNKLDVLFVIDNSASTADKQAVFAQNMSNFVTALDAFPAGRPDLHIAVVNSTVDIGVGGYAPGCPSPDPADNGLFHNLASTPGCPVPSDPFISDTVGSDGNRVVNYPGNLADVLSCIGQVGTDGCGFEHQLESMKRALDGTNPSNAGFLRADADLAVIILTDEDDCSAADPTIFSLPDSTVGGRNDFRCQPLFAYTCTPAISPSADGTYENCTITKGGYLHDPIEYVEFLSTLKDRTQIAVGLIAGDPSTTIATGPLTLSISTQDPALEPSCRATINGNPAIGRPANRLSEFEQAFGDQGVFETVCQPDYSGALTSIGRMMDRMMSSCLDGAFATADTDPTNPGIQPACTVTDRAHFGQADEVDDVIPACEMANATTPLGTGAAPCWYMIADATCSGTTTGLRLQLDRTVAPADDTVVDVLCAH